MKNGAYAGNLVSSDDRIVMNWSMIWILGLSIGLLYIYSKGLISGSEYVINSVSQSEIDYMNLKDEIKDINDKKNMKLLAKNKDFVETLLQETKWLEDVYPKISFKLRCLTIISDYTKETFPKCICGNYITYDKAYQNKFLTVCSDTCHRNAGHLPEDVKAKLEDYNWLYDKRITQRMSHSSIGEILGCSEVPVAKACKRYNFPKIKLNQSESKILKFLDDKEYLQNAMTNQIKLKDIAKQIGSSKATVSVYMKKHGVKANPGNIHPRHGKTSKECWEVINYIKSICTEDVVLNNRSILAGKEIDIFMPSLKIGFEYNGIYSHSHIDKNGKLNKTKDYHQNKTTDALAKGITLFHIFSDDWLFRKDTMKSLIAAKLGIFERSVGARECEIREVSTGEKIHFLNFNHIQGKDKSKHAYGLYLKDELLAVMTFAASRYNKKYVWELNRFAVKKHCKVIGGFTRLLKHFRKLHEGSIISYADRAYSNGGVYEKNGFTLLNTNKAGYKYVNLKESIQRMHRSNFTKSKIADANDPRSEVEIMFAKGYLQIYDCGTFAYVME
jgi:hypothetical protein